MATAIEEAIALEIARARRGRIPDRQTAANILSIPEVGEGVEMRLQRQATLNLDTPDGRREAARRIEAVVALLDDGLHERLVDELRGIAADLAT